jgi:hypothetical protein
MIKRQHQERTNMKTQLNDLFQSALVFGLAALFGTALLSDLRAPVTAHQVTTTTPAMMAQAPAAHHA